MPSHTSPPEPTVQHSASERETSAARPAATRSRLALLTFIPAALVVAVDQWTKALVEAHMSLGQRIDVIGTWVQWHFIKNPGVAFSIGENQTWLATLLASVITCAVLWVALKTRHAGWALTTGLVLGGAVGNLLDRLFREPGFGVGHVVDFIAVGTFPRFNVADSAVSVGVAIVMVFLFRGIDPWPTRDQTDPPAPSDSSAATDSAEGAA